MDSRTINNAAEMVALCSSNPCGDMTINFTKPFIN